jgi:hypothetical protein
MTTLPTMAMPWYTHESWAQLKAVADDELCDTHAEFVHRMTGTIRAFRARGIEVEKFVINVDHMAAWLKRWGHRVDSRGRAIYGAVLAMHDGKLFDLDTPIEIPDRVVH